MNIAKVGILLFLFLILENGCRESNQNKEKVSPENLNSNIEQVDKIFYGKMCFLDSVANGCFAGKPIGDVYSRMDTSATFMEQLTGINSKAGGCFAGRYAPTIQDLLRWRMWYRHNRDSIISHFDSASFYNKMIREKLAPKTLDDILEMSRGNTDQ